MYYIVAHCVLIFDTTVKEYFEETFVMSVEGKQKNTSSLFKSVNINYQWNMLKTNVSEFNPLPQSNSCVTTV